LDSLTKFAYNGKLFLVPYKIKLGISILIFQFLLKQGLSSLLFFEIIGSSKEEEEKFFDCK